MPRKFLLFRTQSGSAWSTINIGTQGGGVILSNNNKTAQVTNNNGALGDTLITKKTYWEISIQPQQEKVGSLTKFNCTSTS